MADPPATSILNNIKLMLGLGPDYDAFDTSVIIDINSALATLSQLGVGPIGGYEITDADSKWEDFLGNVADYNSVKSYVYLRVRMLFDPPATSFLLAAFEKQIEEATVRISYTREFALSGIELPEDQAFLWELDEDGNFPPEAQVGDIGIDVLTGLIWRKT